MTYIAASAPELIHRLAVDHVARAQRFFVTGRIPEGKDANIVDRKLLERYEVESCRRRRYRSREVGAASVRYLRHGAFFVLTSSEGKHVFFEAEAKVLRDFRKNGLFYGGYELRSCWSELTGRWHASVRLAEDRCYELEAQLAELLMHLTPEAVDAELERVPLRQYALVARQLARLRARLVETWRNSPTTRRVA